MTHSVAFSVVLGIQIALIPSLAQLGPFNPADQSGSPGEEPGGLPDGVAVDLIQPAVSPRSTTADRFARMFSKELRDIEERQEEIISELEDLPEYFQAINQPALFGYHSGDSRARPKWIQVDLGKTVEPEAIALFPVTVQLEGETVVGYGFPRSFRIDISDDPNFAENYETIAVVRSADRKGPAQAPFFKEVSGYRGRYIRVTATSLWKPANGTNSEGVFALSELMVLNGQRNLALFQPVKALDSAELTSRWSRRYLTDGHSTLGVPILATESETKGFRADSGEEKVLSSWVQVDLEESMPISQVRLILAQPDEGVPDPALRFPYSLKLEISEYPDMRNAELIRRLTPGQVTILGENPVIASVADGRGRYVRVTAEVAGDTPQTMKFDLAEVQVFSNSHRNIALGKSVTALHSVETNQWSRQFLVDGYGSRRKLAGTYEWLEALAKRTDLIVEWRDKEQKRLELVDQTVSDGLMWTGGGLFFILGIVIIGLRRSRIRRRADIEALRQQIASDLHDDIGSNLSSIALLAELGFDEAEEPNLSREEFGEIKRTADKTIESMRDIVWLIRPGEETWKQMISRFRETAAKLLRAHVYQFNLRGSVNDERLPLDFKRDLFLIYKEVLNNIVKHAEAHRVHIEVDTRKSKLNLIVTDDGKGFNNLDQEFREGNGLKNLRMRAQHIGANLKVKSALGEGTTVHLTAPMP
ncbi:MAG: hypothetical protein HKN23_04605 [Verrucomicrobiales bacterium]|nr:hypothetical protein [Verrucomicrobiales bacterium]